MSQFGSDLPIVAPDDLGPEAPRSILITGAAGNIGAKLRKAWSDTYDLVLVDKYADPADSEIVVADLGDWNDDWTSLFLEVDAVVHLAANGDEFAEWRELERPNLDALANVFAASALAGVDRIIFASSNHAMGEYRHRAESPITVELPPRPDGPYGGAKLMGERLGRTLAAAFGLSFVAIRIGWVQTGENSQETLPHDWARTHWLSNGDLVRLFTRAIEADLEEGAFIVVNGVSKSAGERWSMSEAARLLGFTPSD